MSYYKHDLAVDSYYIFYFYFRTETKLLSRHSLGRDNQIATDLPAIMHFNIHPALPPDIITIFNNIQNKQAFDKCMAKYIVQQIKLNKPDEKIWLIYYTNYMTAFYFLGNLSTTLHGPVFSLNIGSPYVPDSPVFNSVSRCPGEVSRDSYMTRNSNLNCRYSTR